MGDSLAMDIFADTRKSMRRSKAASILVCLFLFGFHLTIYRNYIRLNQENSNTQASIKQYSKVSNDLTQTESELLKTKKAAQNALEDLLGNVTEVMIRKLKALQNTLTQRLQSGFEEADRLLNGPLQQDPVTDEPFPITDEKLENLLKQKDESAIKRYLPKYIERRIIIPVFTDANEKWENRIRAQYVEALSGALSTLSKNSISSTTIKTELTDAKGEIQNLLAELEKISIHPPKLKGWWYTIEGKRGAESDLKNEILRQMDRKKTLREALKQVNTVHEVNRKSNEEYHAKIKAMKNQLQAQQKVLQKLGLAFSIFAVDLETLTSFFPLFIGLLIGVAVHWYASSFRQMYNAVCMIEAENLWNPSIDIWLSGTILWSTISSLKNRYSDSSDKKKKTTKVLIVMQSVFAGIVGVTWIILAWKQAEGIPTIGYIMLCISFVAVLSAVYALFTARMAIVDFEDVKRDVKGDVGSKTI